MDAVLALAKNMVSVRYEDIASEAVEATKQEILDTLAVMVAGSKAPGGREIAEIAKEFGGGGTSTIVVYGDKVSPPYAALANGSMGHALDYDDTYDAAPFHPGTTAVPAALAVAEHVGKVGGKELIAATALAVDLMCRLSLASPRGDWGRESGAVRWHKAPIYGFFGAAACAARLLKLDEESTVNALGIAYSQVAGNGQAITDGALTKTMQVGFAAKGGVLAALMAQKGITGAKNILEGESGFYQVYWQGKYNPVPLTSDLGKRFEVADISFKPYPSCRRSHAYIDAALALVREHGITAEDVEEITAFVGEGNRHLCEPLEVKLNPRSIVDLQVNVPHALATAIIKGNVVIDDFSEAAMRDPLVWQLARKVRPRIDPSLTMKEISPAILEIRSKRGVYSQRVDFAYGHPRNPMSWDALADKFRDCCIHAAKPIPVDHVEAAIAMARKLEQVEDVSQLIRLVS